MASPPDVLLREERHPRIRADEAPPRLGRASAIERTVRLMQRGEWVMVPHARAKSMQRVVRQLGGHATYYKTSDTFSCLKVLDAPWLDQQDEAS
jgi:hypothetical protein